MNKGATPAQHNLLLVDDREENLFSLENLLQEENRNFYKASSGKEALKIAYSENLSLILLDVQMPVMDGFTTASLLKSHPKSKDVPILFVTAINKDQKYVQQGLEEGAIDYLFKPLDAEMTRTKVQNLLKLREHQRRVEEQNLELKKLNEEKNKLLGTVAHDIRGPLGNMSVISDLIESDGELNENQKMFMDMMKQSISFMLNMVNELLDVSKIEAGEFMLQKKEFDIVKMLRKAVDINKLTAKAKKIQVAFDATVDTFNINGDETRLQEVIQNLLSNAIKFSYPETTIKVSASTEGGKFIFSVKDQGQGIPENEQHKLFNYFQTTSTRSTSGEASTGLGLAIVKKIIDAHNGTISLQSEADKGATFTVTI